MSIEVRPATVFDDVATLVGPKNPSSNVCFCLSYRIGSKENVALKGALAPTACASCAIRTLRPAWSRISTTNRSGGPPCIPDGRRASLEIG